MKKTVSRKIQIHFIQGFSFLCFAEYLYFQEFGHVSLFLVLEVHGSRKGKAFLKGFRFPIDQLQERSAIPLFLPLQEQKDFLIRKGIMQVSDDEIYLELIESGAQPEHNSIIQQQMKSIVLVLVLSVLECLKLSKHSKSGEFLRVVHRQSLPPLTLDEFQFRLITNLFNGIQYQKINMDEDNKLLSYQNEFAFNKVVKCHWGQHMVFATKLLFQAISVKLRSFQQIENYHLAPLIMDYLAIKKTVSGLLSIGQNIICHKQIANVELRVDPDYYPLEQSLRESKHQFHENALILMMSILHDELNTLSVDTSKPIKGILNEYFTEIEDFWKLKQQDGQYLVTFFEEIRSIFLALQSIADKNQLEIFDEKWGRILGEFSRAFLMLKIGYQSQITLSELKKRGSTFYDRIKILSRQLYRVQQTENILLFSHLADSIAGIYIVAQNWIVLFEEENTAGKIKNMKNFNHYDFYVQAEDENMNYKVCNFLADFQETLVVQQQIIDSLAEYTFTDEQVQPSFENYKPALDELYMKICMQEPFQCLESLYHPHNLDKVSMAINKIDKTFIERLAILRKGGFITDLMVSQSLKEEEILVTMGYQPFYCTSDHSFCLWMCKMCGGATAITQLKFAKTKDSPIQDLTVQYQNTIKQPDKAYLFLQVFQEDVLIVEKTVIGIVDSQYEVSLNEMFYDSSDSNDVWKMLGYQNKINFQYNFNVWDNERYDWLETDYPVQLKGHRELEQTSFGIVTPNDRTCKTFMIKEIERIEMESLFMNDKYILWNYKFYKEFSFKHYYAKEFEDFLIMVKEVKCQITTQYEQKSNAPDVIISADHKTYYDKQMAFNKKWLFIEKVPEFVLYTAYKWLYPFSKEQLSKMIMFSELRNYLLGERNIVQREIQKVICEKGATFCTFLDTPYELQIEKIAGKMQNQLNVDDNDFNFISTKCKPFRKKMNLVEKNMDIKAANRILAFFSGESEVIQQIIDNGCEFKKIFQFQFPCGRKDRKYLTFDGELQELCFEETEENLHEINRQVSIDQRVPIQRDYFLLIQVTREGHYVSLDNAKIKELGFNYLATWLKFPRIERKSSSNKKYFLTFQVFVRIDPIKHNFLGLVDSYQHIDCLTNNQYFLRWTHSVPSMFKDDSYHFRLEKALQHSIQPIRLTNLKFHLGLLQQDDQKWRTFCGETQCQWARLFIPVKYQGDPQMSCGEEFAVKSLKFFNNFLGLSESCDGKKLPINSVYYLEVVFTNDPSLEVFQTVSKEEQLIARKQGYIPMNTRSPITYSANGVSTVVRLWVKPKANILNYRRFLCEKYIEEEDIFPEKKERDIWTRVVVESYYENNC